MRGGFHGIDRQLDIHVALHLAAAIGVGEFLRRFGHHGEAVVMQPVDQRTDRGILVVFQKRGVVERPQKLAALHEFLPQELVIDVE
jgi:hypothetical protein